MRESGDSLREEISRNLNENLEEHEVVTWTVTGLPVTAYGLQGDTVKVERVTHRERVSSTDDVRNRTEERVRTLTVRDTVYVERKDSVMVQSSKFQVPGSKFQVQSDSLNPRPSSLILTLRWIFASICAIIALVITVKLVWRRGS